MNVYDLIDKEFYLETTKEVDNDFWSSIWPMVNPLIPVEGDNHYKKYDDFAAIRGNTGNELLNKSGKIAKRIAKEFKKVTNEKLPSNVIEAIGNIAYQNTLDAGNYTLKISSKMDTYGNFGDSGSCFMQGGCNRHHFEAMNDTDGFYTLKVWRGGKKFARCWVWVDSDDTLLLFNSYGLVMRDMLSIFLQVHKEFKNVHDKYDIGEIYDNNDGEVVSLDHDHNRRVYASCEISGGCCVDCGERVYEDESYYIDWNGPYCETCYHERYFYCEECNCEHEKDDTEEVEITIFRNGRRWSQYVCENCAKEHGYYKCEDCGEWTEDYYICDDETYCDNCIGDHGAMCEDCGECHAHEDLTAVNGNNYCPDCIGNNAYMCECGKWSENEVCEDCEDKLQIDLFGEHHLPPKAEHKPDCPDCYIALDGGIVECPACYNAKKFEINHKNNAYYYYQRYSRG